MSLPYRYTRTMIIVVLVAAAVGSAHSASPSGGDARVGTPGKADEPAPREAAWVARHQGAYTNMLARVRESGVDVLFLGDDNTVGWGIGGKHGYGARGKQVWAAYYGSLKAARFGGQGDKTQNLLYRVTSGELDGIVPKVVVVQIGVNNLGVNTPAEIAAGIQAAIGQIRLKLPGSTILVMGIFPCGDRAAHPIRAQIADVNSRIAQLDDSQIVFYFDIGPKLLTPDGTLMSDISDGKYLEPKGYIIWASCINPKLEELLDRKIEVQPAWRRFIEQRMRPPGAEPPSAADHTESGRRP